MFRRILIRTLRWGGVAFAVLTVGYVLSIGPGAVFLFYAGPDQGWFEAQWGLETWEALYHRPLDHVPMPVRRPVVSATGWYMSTCDALYHAIPHRIRHAELRRHRPPARTRDQEPRR